jgi:hypothetical protein
MHNGPRLIFFDSMFYSIAVKPVYDGLVPVVGHWTAASIYSNHPVFFLIRQFQANLATDVSTGASD